MSDPFEIDKRPSATPWQYSLRSLFLLTTGASIGMAIGVYYGGFMVVAVAACAIVTGALLSADWLIRPQNRRALAFVTASAWIVVGSGLLMLGLQIIASIDSLGKRDWDWSLGGILVAAGLMCYYIASRRWRTLAAQAVAKTGLNAPAASRSEKVRQ